MPKIKTEIYQCDGCEERFFEPHEVLRFEDPIEDGDNSQVLEDGMYCPACFIEKVFVDRDLLDDIIEISERVQDEMAQKDEKEETKEEKMPWDGEEEEEEDE